jgi:Protein of unknown function (DUF2934)
LRIFSVRYRYTLIKYEAFPFLSTEAYDMSNKLQEMTQDIQARVREAAYLMWESAGRQQGMAMEYWLKAERDVLATLQSTAERLMPMGMGGKHPASKADGKPAVQQPALESKPAPMQTQPTTSAAAQGNAQNPAPRKPASRSRAKA